MITEIGKTILSKYLIGQAPAYASYIAVGCGPKPLGTNELFDAEDYKSKKSLDFEMFRVPIISRGFVNDNGVDKIVLTAELPTDERYEISEVGIYSAGANPSAGAYDSRSLFAFTVNENWEYHDQTSAKALPIIYNALDDKVVYITAASVSGNNITFTTDVPHGFTQGTQISVIGASPTSFNISGQIVSVPSTTQFVLTSNVPVTVSYISGGYAINDAETNVINQPYYAFQTNSDNKTFTNSARIERYETGRFFNNIVMLRGDSADLSIQTQDGIQYLQPSSTSNHLHLLGTSLDFNKNAPTDEIKLAFSVINKSPSSSIVPSAVRIMVEFAETDASGTGQSASFNVIMNNGTGVGQYDFANNRYYVLTKQLQELKKTTGFTWNNVTVVKIYATVLYNGQPSSDFYIGLDAVRFENTSTANAVYGLTGYTVLKNTNAQTIVKEANTTNYIEFRFAMDVQ